MSGELLALRELWLFAALAPVQTVCTLYGKLFALLRLCVGRADLKDL